MDYTNEQLDEHFRRLPPEIQGAIASVETAKTMQRIGEKYGLYIDQIGKLAYLVGLVMFGLLSATELPERIQKEINLTPTKTKDLVFELDQAIFQKIREILRRGTAVPIATVSIPVASPAAGLAAPAAPSIPRPVSPPVLPPAPAPVSVPPPEPPRSIPPPVAPPNIAPPSPAPAWPTPKGPSVAVPSVTSPTSAIPGIPVPPAKPSWEQKPEQSTSRPAEERTFSLPTAPASQKTVDPYREIPG